MRDKCSFAEWHLSLCTQGFEADRDDKNRKRLAVEIWLASFWLYARVSAFDDGKNQRTRVKVGIPLTNLIHGF
jgi:hypothetical protein